jgi:S1-C subfamily serine protease
VISPLSARSVYIRARLGDETLGTGTGFIVKHNNRQYLITNYHVASGRNPTTGQPRSTTGAIPTYLHVDMPQQPGGPPDTVWHTITVPVLDVSDDGYTETARWLEHPTHGREVDVVAVPLGDVAAVPKEFTYDLADGQRQLKVRPASEVNVIGFPFGLHGSPFGGLGIWTHGFVASEPDIDFDGLPTFLVDARTREGQSGAPVIAYSDGRVWLFASGAVESGTGREVVNVLGVYSGRISEESDLGIVWKVQVVRDILAAQRPGRSGLNPG